ncbi:hypothetical protein QFV92_000272 [Salmonella enterica]|nr:MULTISPECIES: hypothetical protein [Salmonella]EBU0430665.1 hypothetical protein [Salmonella enterica]ECM8012573.1 hypothetical protein [Salmonella enterica subsp. enterica serovar Newport]EGP3502143.1 hypothetical protein [Salmonella enterica subsp. enterica serovar Newport]EKY5349804.1 hypothetical protein [Salmonella enterica]MBO1965942.1 hypothetical protein [Salmonella sp. 32040203-2019-00173]
MVVIRIYLALREKEVDEWGQPGLCGIHFYIVSWMNMCSSPALVYGLKPLHINASETLSW